MLEFVKINMSANVWQLFEVEERHDLISAVQKKGEVRIALQLYRIANRHGKYAPPVNLVPHRRHCHIPELSRFALTAPQLGHFCARLCSSSILAVRLRIFTPYLGPNLPRGPIFLVRPITNPSSTNSVKLQHMFFILRIPLIQLSPFLQRYPRLFLSPHFLLALFFG